jgi:hypothetical protein
MSSTSNPSHTQQKPFSSIGRRPTFALKLRLFPRTGAIELASVEVTCQRPPERVPASTHMYALPFTYAHGGLCEVIVIAEVIDNGDSSATAVHRPVSRPSRKRPRPPGLCGGAIAAPADTDVLEAAPARARIRAAQEYQALLDRLTRASQLRTAQA